MVITVLWLFFARIVAVCQVFKPTDELMHYNIASDNSIGTLIYNKKTKKTYNLLYKIPKDKDLQEYIDTLTHSIAECTNKNRINKLKKELRILKQVLEKENLKKLK